MTKGLAPFNPLSGLRRARSSRAEKLLGARKGHALDDGEIAALWTSAGVLGPFGGLVRLALLSGLRRNELGGLRWSGILNDRIVVEAERAKTGARHEIPLTGLMKTVLSAQARTTSDLVFPNRSDERMRGWTSLVERAIKLSGVSFKLHDLGRTARTLMSRSGVSEEVAELAIGHVRRGLVGTYNKDQAWASRVDAFERISAHIANVIASKGASREEEGRDVIVHAARSPRVKRRSANWPKAAASSTINARRSESCNPGQTWTGS